MEAIIQEKTSSHSRRESLEHYLCSQIRVGQLRPGDKISTGNLAKQWNVSEGTVNQSLHILAAKGLLVRKPRAGTFVGEEADTKQQLAQINRSVALIMPDLKQPEFSCVFHCLQRAATNSSFTVSVFGTDDSVENYTKIIREQIEAKSAAIALVPPLAGTLPVELLIELYESKIPVLTYFRALGGFGWPVIRLNEAYNTQIAVRHLCELGRKSIGLVLLDVPNSYSDLLKEYTFINTLDEFGLTAKRDMRLMLPREGTAHGNNQMWFFNAIEAIENWLCDHPDIDGICCLHDRAAWAVLSALAKIGKKVPEDVALIGNGNMMEFYGFAQNDLTTVDCCYEDFGSVVLNTISDICSGISIEPNKIIEIKGRLIVRHSTIGNSNFNKAEPVKV